MTITNRYAGNCLACRKRVEADRGLAIKVDGKWSVYHHDCAPSAASPAPRPSIGQQMGYGKAPDSTIELRTVGDRIQIRPAGYLGTDLFDRYRSACGGATYDRVERCNYASADLVGAIVVRLTAAGFKLDVDPAVTAAVQAWEARARADTAAATGRAAEIDAALRARGLALFPFQAQGVSWLAPRDRAILADDPGCIDGDAIVAINRAGKGFSLTLSELCHRFNGGRIRGGKLWNPAIPTKIRALCDGVFHQHEIRAVLDKGVRPVLKLTLASGKAIRLTPDHEVAVADGSWRAAEALAAGSKVLVNGQPVSAGTACPLCGATKELITYPRAKFVGHCRTCAYRKLRAKPTWIGGKSLDKDGYVLVSGQWEHPRHDQHGCVREHHLVMEAMIGRYLVDDETVHHKNEVKNDNRPENLELLTKSAHAIHHGREGGFRRLDGSISGRGGEVIFIPKVDIVVNVVPDGIAHVYDIVCADPHRNFVANGIVVHNCGKTVEALAALPADIGILVIAPAVAKGVWERECRRWRPDLKVTVLSGRGSFRWPLAGEMLVLNYDIQPTAPLDTAERGRRAKVEEKLALACKEGRVDTEAKYRAALDADDAAIALMGAAPSGVVVIADEFHAVKGAPKKVARSANFKAIADAAFKAGGRVWGLTGTPLLNRPSELWALLSLIRAQNVVFGSYPNFKRFCGGYDTGYGTQWSAGSISSTVGDKLREVMLRRMKADVLDQLPAKTVEVVDVALDADSIKRLDAIEAELAEQGIDLMQALKAAASNQSIAFEQVARARAMLAVAKAAAAMDMADDFEESGEPVIVFSAHRAPIDVLAKRDGWATITGDTPNAERTRIEDSFQRGELKGIAATIKAAGVAITLTRASNAIFVDSEWTPKLNEQAEDRIYRIGQDRAVKIVYLKADHEIDDRVFELCAIKRGIVARTVDAAAHRDGALAERVDAAAALASAKASGDHAQRQRDNEELADRIRRDRAKADADRVRSKAASKAEAANASRGWRIPPEAFETPPRPAQSEAEEWAVQALATLTSMDGDHAFEENGVGFNKADTYVGQALAAAARAGLLSDGEWQVALKLLRKYHGQTGWAPGDGPEEMEVAS